MCDTRNMTDICETKHDAIVCVILIILSVLSPSQNRPKKKNITLREMRPLLPLQNNAELIFKLTACNRNKLHIDKPTPL